MNKTNKNIVALLKGMEGKRTGNSLSFCLPYPAEELEGRKESTELVREIWKLLIQMGRTNNSVCGEDVTRPELPRRNTVRGTGG